MTGSNVEPIGDVLVDTAAAPFARLLFAHGAGAPMDSGFMNDMAAALAEHGLEVVRFEFPYMAKRRRDGKRRPPNRMDVLLDAWDAMIEQYRCDSLPLFIGGKSMGARAATVWAAERAAASCRGLICFGYPFHPPGKPENLRIAHLSECAVPLLIVQGERDALGSREEVSAYGIANSIHFCWLASGDHDLKPLRRSGYSHQQHKDAAAQAASAFICAALKGELGSLVF